MNKQTKLAGLLVVAGMMAAPFAVAETAAQGGAALSGIGSTEFKVGCTDGERWDTEKHKCVSADEE